MAETIRTMLVLSKIDSHMLVSEPSMQKLKPVLDECVALQERVRTEKNIHLSVDCLSGLELLADTQLLKEILINLISNAYKYTPAGGRVTINASAQGSQIAVNVTDTGCGIPVAEHNRVSTKFFRASNVGKMDESGTGIGLYLVYKLVKILGGSISFVSQENHGTTFTLLLPSHV